MSGEKKPPATPAEITVAVTPVGQKLCEEMIQKFEIGLTVGGFFETVARACGVGRSTAKGWRKRGREDIEAGKVDTLHAQFAQRVEAATAMGEMTYVGALYRNAADGDTKAAAFMLERRHPDRWGPPKTRTELTGKDGGPIQTAKVVMLPVRDVDDFADTDDANAGTAGDPLAPEPGPSE